MEKVVTSKAYGAPTLWVEIGDLRIPCAVPTVKVVEDILEKAARVLQLENAMSQERYDFAFDLFAEILSCNHNFVSFTPEELKGKNITVTQIIGILTDWVEFIGSLAELKN